MTTLRDRQSKGSELTHNELDANFQRDVQAKATTYSVLVSDNRSLLECSHATTAFTVTLGDAATMAAAETGDFEVTISNINNAIVTVAPAGTDTIDGSTASIYLNKNQSVTLKVNSTTNGYISIHQFKHSETKYKTADETISSDDTLSNDTHLAGWVLEADTVYKIDGAILLASGATPDFKAAFITDNAPQIGEWHSATNQTTYEISATPDSFSTTSNGTVMVMVFIKGMIHANAAAATTMSFQWAQNISDAANTTVHKGSWITVEKLGNA